MRKIQTAIGEFEVWEKEDFYEPARRKIHEKFKSYEGKRNRIGDFNYAKNVYWPWEPNA